MRSTCKRHPLRTAAVIGWFALSPIWGPVAEAHVNPAPAPLPVKNVTYGLYVHDVVGLRTQRPQTLPEPLRASGRSQGVSVRIVEPRGDLPPWSIINCESKGSYTAENPYSTASGRYQFVDGTWNGYGGYSHASDAPPEVQDAKAREVWANGAGRGHWRECL